MKRWAGLLAARCSCFQADQGGGSQKGAGRGRGGESKKLTRGDWGDRVDLELTAAALRSKAAESTELTERLTAKPTWS